MSLNSMSKRKKIWIGVGVTAVAVVVITLLAVFLAPSDEETNTTTPSPITPSTSTPIDPPATTQPSVLPPTSGDQFNDNFLFGCASAAFQIEGAWNKDGKGESIWDRLTHMKPSVVLDGSNADVAANSYELYKEDVKALKQIGARVYRFSISWPRVLSNGDISSRNELGLQYYDNLINELLANGIQPMVTMYHWDLPQQLQELGGWANRHIIPYFEQYARLLFERYGDRVMFWNTFNEAALFCYDGYKSGHAPRVWSPAVGTYLCAHHVLLSHARAYRIYDQEYRSKFGGKIGIALNSGHAWPKDAQKRSDVEAADRSTQFQLGLYAQPIFGNGDYPEVVKQVVDKNSRYESLPKSRLPRFTEEEIKMIKGSADFMGLNYYTSAYVEEGTEDWMPSPSFARDRNIIESHDPNWPQAKSSWLKSVPEGLRGLLNWIRTEYDNPEVIITENGWSDDGELNDIGRIEYMNTHLQAILDANKDGCRVFGYTHWSIIDNYEWTLGYTERFGMFHIDFNHKSLTRTAKRSVSVYADIIQKGRIPTELPPNPPNPSVFPDDFMFGCASSSYQIEGAWNKDGKGESIWDRLTHTQPEVIAGRTSGDEAGNSYELYKEDVALLKNVGAKFYRFSISWPRIMPNGDVSSLNEAGLRYYDNLINELLANDIQPMVTMYHWDLPQSLQEIGGWPSRTIIDYFEQYAKALFDRYADRVKYWNTFNEAALFCTSGYEQQMAPRLWSPGHAPYLCAHHVLLSHARVYHLYQRDYRAKHGGKIGLAMNSGHAWPKNPNSPADVEAAIRSNQFQLGLYAHPIYVGDYPEMVRRIVDENSRNENLDKSRLPKFTAEEIDSIRGTSDFFGLNYYTSAFAEEGTQDWMPSPSFARDRNIIEWHDPKWPVAKSTWLRSVPQGFTDLLRWIRDHYGNPEVIITENGWSDGGDLDDTGRIDYMRAHLEALLEARADGCNVKGYAYWSVIDNFEWLMGYTEKFGLYHVDFGSAQKTRTAKRSVAVYRDIIESKRILYTTPPAPLGLMFPPTISFGAASAAYQIEGAWNTDGKGESIWDRMIHEDPDVIKNRDNADVAANSYELYKEDVKALKLAGLQFYRFSISWPRVLPDGDISSRNELGLQYYDNLINELLANGITPMVTMYHWDLPQRLQELGGWANVHMAEYFEQYAGLLYERYGDRVKSWITFNEPALYCPNSYSGDHPPRAWSPGVGEYLCGHTVLLSHARAYRLYRSKYYDQQKGRVGISLNTGHTWPANPHNPSDVEAADRVYQFGLGWFAHPIFSKSGDYPSVLVNRIAENSAKEGRGKSRLPKFTEAEIELLRGSADFLGLNYYSSGRASDAGSDYDITDHPSRWRDQNTNWWGDDDWPVGASVWLLSIPQGLRELLKYVRDEYGNPETIITENGWSDHGELDDDGRIAYLKGHLNALLLANVQDSCNVTAYTYWSLTDNFEWHQGYSERFGLFHIDFENPSRPRTPKRSVAVMQDIIRTRRISSELPPIPPNPHAFPEDFIFGCASSSYQIEGAWDRDGKGESIWDHLTHTQPEVIVDRSTGDIAGNSYELYPEDVKALKQMGAQFYRFSVSWPRIMPNGDVSSLNEAGLQYYDNLINELLANGIQPMLTMYHWDLPQSLQEIGGWPSRTIIDYFEQYAKALFDRYADRVKYWNTFNEAALFCTSGYSAGHAPRLWSPGVGSYLCAHHVLLSHARVYHLFHTNYSHKHGGKIGIAINSGHAWPKDPTKMSDIEAAERSNQFQMGLYAHPIFSREGDYPEVVRRAVDANSEAENLPKSRLPEFTPEEVRLIRGSADFFGLNYYTSAYVEEGTQDWMPWPSVARDRNIIEWNDPNWPVAKSFWLRSIPKGFTDLLKYIRDEYENPEVIITENGWSDDGELNDVGRIEYLRTHLQALQDAINAGCKVTGYAHWSIIDNFEWTLGYTERFGLYHVDFNDTQRTRTPKRSVAVYKNIIASRVISYKMPPVPVEHVFPQSFRFGSGSSAYQIEGAWYRDGKGESIWDRSVHVNPNNIWDRANGDVAANSYDLYKEDVQALVQSGSQFYRFSISWSRVLADGDISSLNELGLRYYDNLIDELLSNGIEPMITMYHWDLPQRLQELGGWANRYIVDYFEQYAGVLYARYADRVKTWITINEPAEFCSGGYSGNHPPHTWSPGVGEYMCGHHALLAHARAYHLYKNVYFSRYNGKVGIALNTAHMWPLNPDSPSDVAAADRAYQFSLGWFAHPLFSASGNYPNEMIDRIAYVSQREGRIRSRLPQFSDAELILLRGAADFLGLNYFISGKASDGGAQYDFSGDPSKGRDQNTNWTNDDSWPIATSGWLRSVPEGLRELLRWVREAYDNPEVIITENGWSDDGQLNDMERIDYLRSHLAAVLEANVVDGCNVTGYTYWSIIDNFEWHSGYHNRFGLFHVDFDSTNKTRTMKKSASVYRSVIETKRIPFIIE